MVRVEVVYCPQAAEADLSRLDLDDGAVVRDALAHSGVLQRHALDADRISVGVWFRPCGQDQPLRDGDQVQVYRPLTVDPKQARRLRVAGMPRPTRPSRPSRPADPRKATPAATAQAADKGS